MGGYKIIRKNHNFPLASRHLPLQYFGIKTPHPYKEHGIYHIKLCIQHTDANMVVGHFLCSQLEKFHLEVGMGTPLFKLTYNDYAILFTDTRTNQLWGFLWIHGIILET